MSQMENLLMGGDSSGSDSDGESNKAAAASQVTASTAGSAGTQQQQASKSALTNRLKNLYGSPPGPPPGAVPPPGGPGAPGGPVPRGGPPPPGAPVAQRRGSGSVPLPAPLPPGRGAAPPPTTGRAQVPAQRPPGAPQGGRPVNPNYAPPTVHGAPPPPHPGQRGMAPGPPPPGTVGRVPAPLPAARTAARSAPPTSRVASVPAGQQRGAPPVVTGAPPPSPLVPNQPGQARQYPRAAPHLRGPQPSPAVMAYQGAHPQQPMPPPPGGPPASRGRATPDSRSSGGGGSGPQLTAEEKKEKERFLMFTRVLMKYLEQRDAVMHANAKTQIKECYEKNKQGDPAFQSLTTSMKARLRETVGELYWKKAHDYLDHFLKQKKDARSRGSSRSSSSSQKQQQQEANPFAEQTPPLERVNSSEVVLTPPQPLPTQAQAAAAKKVQLPPATVAAATSKAPAKATAAKGGAKGKETDEEKKKRERKNEQNRKRREKRKQEAKAKAEKAAAATGVAVLPTGKGIQHSMTPTGGGTPSAASMTSSTASVTSASSSKAKDKKTDAAAKKKKKKAAPVRSPSITKRQNSLKQPTRLMESVDHAVLIDVKTIPNLLSKEHKLDVNLDEEQRILLYGDEKRQARVKDITKAAAEALSAGPGAQAGGVQSKLAAMEEAGIPPLPWKLPASCSEWGNKNVLDIRTAWSKVRLPEFAEMRAEREKEAKERAVLAERAVPSGSSASKPPQAIMPPAPSIKDDTTNHVWYNEIRASSDPTLAMLSEATETFLKSAIENAIGQARLRQNLDGVRLWHTLHAQSVASGATANGGKDAGNGDKPPAALIRLGCDVDRQIALAEGNAAKTYQRMEEAISRRNDTYRADASQDPDAMLLESTSMGDLSTRPPLKSAAQTADVDAKRKFEVFCGSESQEPPLGRVPKHAMVTLQDILVGELGNRTSMIGARKKRFRVGLRY